MAAPYCTLTGTIPGGEKGRAIVRIIPDVVGATATVNGVTVGMREHTVRTDQAGAVNVEVLAPGAGVTPSGAWTHTIYVDSPGIDLVKHLALTQGGEIDIMAADPTDEIAPLPFGGVGTPADLSNYPTKAELAADLKQKADRVDLNATNALVAKNLNPFQTGARYYSPVTYYWPDYYQDGKPGQFSKWAQTLKFRDELGYVIMNRNSGDWEAYEKDFKKQAELALAAGAKKILFYIKTHYGVASLPATDPARNNIPNPDKFTKTYILEHLKRAKQWYGDLVQGVFLDEVINGWGTQAARVPWYKDLIDTIRTNEGLNFVIGINTGSNISEEMCKLDFNVCMMYEGTAQKFLTNDEQTPILPAHMAEYPSTRWWATVHTTNSLNYREVFQKLDSLGIGHVYVTDGVLAEDGQNGGQWAPVGNPYANPPGEKIRELIIPWIKGYLELKLRVDGMTSNGSKILVLGKDDPVPAGTPAGTVIVRRAR